MWLLLQFIVCATKVLFLFSECRNRMKQVQTNWWHSSLWMWVKEEAFLMCSRGSAICWLSRAQ